MCHLIVEIRREGNKNEFGKEEAHNDKGGIVILEQILIFFGHRIPIGLWFCVILNPIGPQIYLLSFPSHCCSKSRIGDHRSGKYTMYLGR